jgi:ribosomal protein S15P/S13E
MHDLLEKWASPAGVLIMFGGVVWGVQLNIATMNLTKELSAIDGRTNELSKELVEVSKNTIRTSVILNSISKEVDNAMNHVESHKEDAEDWKRRILINEQRLKDMEAR